MDDKNLLSTIGIDFSGDYTQVSVFNEELEPVSMSIIKNETKYLIPTIIFIEESTGNWYIGDEAIVKNNTSIGKLFDNIPKLVKTQTRFEVDQNVFDNIQLIAFFMEKVLDYVYINTNIEKVENIVVSIAGSERSEIEMIYNAFEKIDYRQPNVRVISHNESFANYVCSQKSDIWVNSVLMLNFRGGMLVARTLYNNSKRGPHIVTVTEEVIPNVTTALLRDDSEACDIALAQFLDLLFRRNVYSACFLIGEAFNEDDKIKRSMALLCANKRVFKGHNLIVKGAGFAARELFGDENIDVVILCKGRTRLEISLSALYENRERQVVMSQAGTNWYDAGFSVECIVDKTTACKIYITNPLTKMTNNVFLNIDDFPQRGNKQTRVEVKVAYKNEDTILLSVIDKGFGDFFESSGMETKKEIRVSDYL